MPGAEPQPTPPGARQLILDTAVRLFAERGYLGASINDIATAAGLTKGAVFHYFPRKSSLLLEIHDACLNLLLERVDERQSLELTATEELRHLVSDVMYLTQTMPNHVRVFFEDWRHIEPDVLTRVLAIRDRYAQHLEATIAAGTAEGTFRDLDPKLASFFTFGVVNWAYQWYRPSGTLDHEQIAEAMTDFVERGLRGPA